MVDSQCGRMNYARGVTTRIEKIRNLPVYSGIRLALTASLLLAGFKGGLSDEVISVAVLLPSDISGSVHGDVHERYFPLVPGLETVSKLAARNATSSSSNGSSLPSGTTVSLSFVKVNGTPFDTMTHLCKELAGDNSTIMVRRRRSIQKWTP